MTVIQSLSAEWERIELLCEIMSTSAGHKEPVAEDLARLSALQGQVEALRRDKVWKTLAPDGLSMLELDIFACAIAFELSANVGNFFRRESGTNHSEITLRTLKLLLSLAPADMPHFYGALHVDSALREAGLIYTEGEGSNATMSLAPSVRRKLFHNAFLTAPPHTTKITREVSRKDLILNQESQAQIDMFLDHIHFNQTVEDWGARKQSGPVALFCGVPGTGKTLAASVIAAELEWPLFRADLGRLVSKYIGETEKNLNAVFAAASNTQILLLFDEADALFGKRSEVSDARDRYANMEISHLLTLIEGHLGPVILTTNLRGHLDRAFLRRFHVLADFPKPDIKARRELWTKYIPAGAPIDPKLDYDLLAKSVNLTGAEIENAAVRAAIGAAKNDTVIDLRLVANAVFDEIRKQNSALKASSMGALAEFVREMNLDKTQPSSASRAA